MTDKMVDVGGRRRPVRPTLAADIFWSSFPTFTPTSAADTLVWVPPNEIQGPRHSSRSDQLEATNGSHIGFGLSLVMDSQSEVMKIMVIVWKSGN